MSDIRRSQLMAPFGPGIIYTDIHGTPHVICGLDHWFTRDAIDGGAIEKDAFELLEPRLLEHLAIDKLYSPPDYRPRDYINPNQPPPPNTEITIPWLRFPRWYRHTWTGHLRRFNFESRQQNVYQAGRQHEPRGRYLAVRFVTTCRSGHLSDFPWKRWAGCECPGDQIDAQLYLDDRGGSDLVGITVRCKACNRKSNLSGATSAGFDGADNAFQKKGIGCASGRAWFGDNPETPCGATPVAALINQGNLYFSQTASALHIPEADSSSSRDYLIVQGILDDNPPIVTKVRSTLKLYEGEKAMVSPNLRKLLLGVAPKIEGILSVELLDQLLDKHFGDQPNDRDQAAAEPAEIESTETQFRRREFNTLRESFEDSVAKNLCIVEEKDLEGTNVGDWLQKLCRVERLRETRAFNGFSRLEAFPDPEKPAEANALSQLFLTPPEEHHRWLPAIQVFGEGLYLEIKEEALLRWQQVNADWLKKRLGETFRNNVAAVPNCFPPLTGATLEWTSRYLLVHTISHLLTNQLVFHSGYGTAALRERLYVSADSAAPMAGILIYTAAGDSEGTLGGLVRLGHARRFNEIFEKAIEAAEWCSFDPVCSESIEHRGTAGANLAACHACALLPETACESMNHGLDRAVVVGEPDDRSHGFRASLEDTA